ncbi:sensor histidine kinase [Streptomyces actinomycinicus]|uniref:histidine kinase n=1 Tax=Streptomyces actinomycinicus TaxID=1695166 RepID=A0A937EKF5_9ACTN|nr:nitrate- and nitrite sensing domain-containing protein [Streptomyces actinomycinicus]MBL1083689.1 sensor histidine kinase [Streptomyces actinomycinicus]
MNTADHPTASASRCSSRHRAPSFRDRGESRLLRFGGRSIRTKIIALLVIPLVSLVALWAYASLTAAGDVRSLLKADDTYDRLGGPVAALAEGIQAERRAAVAALADPDDDGAQLTVRRSRAETDRLASAVRRRAQGDAVQNLDTAQRATFTDVLNALDELGSLRSRTDHRSGSWDQVMHQYNQVLTPALRFRTSFTALRADRLAQRSAVHNEMVRAREYLSQEDAAIKGVYATMSRGAAPTENQYRVLDSALEAHMLLFDDHLPEFSAGDRAAYDRFLASPAWQELEHRENDFLAHEVTESDTLSEHGTEAGTAGIAKWRDAAHAAVADLGRINNRLAASLSQQAEHDAQSMIRGTVIAGGIGLIAVVLSVLVSMLIGRSLVRQLVRLRNAAEHLATQRLPDVMRRLRTGETVDVAEAAPPLDFGPNEIGQVGRAFNVIQHAAVEAAVEQAELRRAAASVFVNLARRSQVLLHRQLTMLDDMERRTEDPDDLGNLFRLDHLTTRMRRHAEGLIILSGGSPGRAWRRSVPVIDVVRAAVAEVEDYPRIFLRSFPQTSLVGPAVGDVTHLVAELLENATAYSPPGSAVTVIAEVAANGFILEIEDRGIGMGAEARAEAQRRLSDEQEHGLPDAQRLGLFVVNRLARKHGIKVSLKESAYGGTSAVLLIPTELMEGLRPVAAPGGHESPAVAQSSDEAVEQMPLANALRLGRGLSMINAPGTGGAAASAAATRPVRHRPVSSADAGTANTAGEDDPGALPHRRPPAAHTAHSRRDHLTPQRRDDGRPPARPEREASTDGLPRRVRQSSLAPQLRGAGSRPTADGSPARSSRERSPEEARAAVASFSQGLARGKAEGTGPAADAWNEGTRR